MSTSKPKRPYRSSRFLQHNAATTADNNNGGLDSPSTITNDNELTLQDVTPDFNTWTIENLAQYKKALKLPTSKVTVSMPKPLDMSWMHLAVPPPNTRQQYTPELISIRTTDFVSQYQIDMRESVAKHYHSVAPIPLIPNSVTVNPRNEAETILYFMYTAKFNRFRALTLPQAEAFAMVREVREGKFFARNSSSSVTAVRHHPGKDATLGLSGSGPFNVAVHRGFKRIA